MEGQMKVREILSHHTVPPNEPIPTIENPSDRGSGAFVNVLPIYRFKFSIQPPEMFDLTSDVPNLTGDKDPAGDNQLGDVNPHSLKSLRNGAGLRWDVSRRVQYHILNPSLIPYGKMTANQGRIYDGEPNADLVTVQFPATPFIGNDDSDFQDEGDNPYAATTAELPPAHNVGEITSFDPPSIAFPDAAGHDNITFQEDDSFEEFARLEIGNLWYVVSDPIPWKLTLKIRFDGTQWVDDGSTTGLGN